MPELETLGWDAGWEEAFEPHRTEGRRPGRVAAPHRGGWYDVLSEDGDIRARTPGRLRHEAASPAALPVVGDWVALERPRSGATLIQAVLPRRTKLSRRGAHERGSEAAREQVVASNVDLVFVTAAINDELDPRLLERYLALAWQSGTRPVILLTKADVHPDPIRVAEELAEVGSEVPVVAVSTRPELGLDRVRSFLEPGVTGALLGPSGVGKSTLVNALVGDELLATASVRADGSGRHTTTRRQLVLLPEGGMVVDNPGIRDLHLWVEGDDELDEAFADVAELAAGCKFSDCSHTSEPGCAVQAALAGGTLTAERWQTYREVRRELAELEDRVGRPGSRARRGRPGTGAA